MRASRLLGLIMEGVLFEVMGMLSYMIFWGTQHLTITTVFSMQRPHRWVKSITLMKNSISTWCKQFPMSNTLNEERNSSPSVCICQILFETSVAPSPCIKRNISWRVNFHRQYNLLKMNPMNFYDIVFTVLICKIAFVDMTFAKGTYETM